MGGIAGPIQQVANTVGQVPQQPGQVPQTANVDFGFNPTQNVPFRPQQIPGNLGFPSPIQSPPPFNYQNVASQYPNINPAEIIDLGGYSGQAYAQQLAKLQGMGVNGLPDFNPIDPMAPQIQGMSRGQPSYGPTSQEAYNRFLATAKPAQGGSLPSYEQFVQNRSAPRPFLGPQRPMQPQGPQQPFNPRPYPGQGNDMAVVTRPYNPNAGIEPVQVQPPRPTVIQPGPGVFPRPQPQDSKRGLGGLQLDKFRRRLG